MAQREGEDSLLQPAEHGFDALFDSNVLAEVQLEADASKVSLGAYIIDRYLSDWDEKEKV